MEAWGAESGHIEVTVRDAVAVVTLGRPDRLNALTAGMRRELAAILRHFGDGELSRGIVVTGAGRAFSAGLDLREAAKLPRRCCRPSRALLRLQAAQTRAHPPQTFRRP